MIEVGDVDIVVDHDDIFRRIGRGAALRRDVPGLHRVAGIALLDRDAVEHARAADLVAPYLRDAGHAGIGDVLLDGGRAHHRAVARHLVWSAAHRRHAEHDRIVAVIDRLDVEHRAELGAAGIVAGPFAERAFDDALVRRDIALQHDLGAGRERQAGDLALHHLHRPCRANHRPRRSRTRRRAPPVRRRRSTADRRRAPSPPASVRRA